jgi:hypothetical protein
MRAESLTEVPVIGRLLTTGMAKRSGPAVPEAVLAAVHDGQSEHGAGGGVDQARAAETTGRSGVPR